MSGDAQQIAVELCHINWQDPSSLHSICMEGDLASLFAILPISAMGWMVPTSLLACMMVIRMVSGRIAFPDVFGIHKAITINRQKGDFKAVILKELAGIHHCVVLDARGDDVIAALGPGPGHPFDGQVVCL